MKINELLYITAIAAAFDSNAMNFSTSSGKEETQKKILASIDALAAAPLHRQPNKLPENMIEGLLEADKDRLEKYRIFIEALEVSKKAEEKYNTIPESDKKSKDIALKKWIEENAKLTDASNKWLDAKKTVDELKKVMAPHLLPIVSDEIYDGSRDPKDATEKNASDELKRFLTAKNIEIRKVRFIDPEPFIDSMKLPKERRDYLIDLAALPEASKTKEIEKLIDGFVSNSEFSNDVLRENVRESMKRGSSDRTYRNLILTLIAWIEATPKIYDGVAQGFEKAQLRQIKFTDTKELNCEANGNEVLMNYSMLPFYNSPLCRQQQIPMSMDRVLFHELGHIISLNIADADTELGVDHSFEIAKNLFETKIDVGVLEKYIKAIGEIKEEFRAPIINYWNKTFDVYFKDIGEIAKDYGNRFGSPEGFIRTLLTSSPEVLQVNGLHYDWKNKVLYINKFSDFDLYAKMALPIRSVHARMEETLKSKESTPESDAQTNTDEAVYKSIFGKIGKDYGPIITCDINRDFYRVLFKVFGYDMDDYEGRLTKK